jgi:tetratricopeptide (TPR) repeat protein
LIRRYDAATEPTIREQVAEALLNKARVIGSGWFFDERNGIVERRVGHYIEQMLAIYDDLLRRFETATETGVRSQVARALFYKARTADKLDYIALALATYDKLLPRLDDPVDEWLRSKTALTLFDLGEKRWGKGDFEHALEYLRRGSILYQDNQLQLTIEWLLLTYYKLERANYLKSPGYELPKRVITEAELREYIKEQASLLTKRLSQAEEQPFPILPERTVKAIVAHGKKHPWDDRKKQGWPYHTNAFVYVHITYRKWVNRGLTREILAWADPGLHAHLNIKINREGGLPAWLDVPSGPEAKLRSIADPVKRAKLEGVREFFRDQKRRTRSRKLTQ